MGYLLAELRHKLRKLRLGIQPGDLVLDVGSGNNPHFRADVLCDRYVADDTQREGRLYLDRPMAAGDVHNLPFKDGAFDYVICSHLLEHVDNPDRAVQELTRVARRGYVETPSEFGEKLEGAQFHRWFVRLENGVLVFREKGTHPYDTAISGPLWVLHARRDTTWNVFRHTHFDMFVTCCEWEGSLPTEVIRGEVPYDPMTTDTPTAKGELRHSALASDILRRLTQRRHALPDWCDICRSTCCDADVVSRPGLLACSACGREFPIREGVPLFCE